MDYTMKVAASRTALAAAQSRGTAVLDDVEQWPELVTIIIVVSIIVIIISSSSSYYYCNNGYYCYY